MVGIVTEMPLSPRETQPVIDGVANHPAKMMTLMTMARTPSEAYGERGLYRALMDLQCGFPGWDISKPTPHKYCGTSLSNAGVVEAKATPHQAYSISETGLRIGVPIVGSVANWDLEYPDFSALVILGASNNPAEYDKGTPSFRLGMYALLGSGISVARLAERTDVTTGRVHVNLEALEAEGVVEIGRKYNPAERTLHINQPSRSNLEAFLPQSERADPTTVAIYETAKILPAKGGPAVVMSGDEFINEVLEVNPDLERQAIWDAAVDAKAQDRLAFIEIEDFILEKALTQVQLSPEYEKPVRELQEAIEQLHADGAYVKWARQRAYEISEDPETAAVLMKKAYEFSTAAHAKNLRRWAGIIAAHIPEEGVDSRNLYQSIRANGSGRITYKSFRNLLSKLDGRLVSLSDRKGGGRMNTTISYVELNLD
ncbi:MAG: hypothetical protein JWL89_158 [Candidatus Saccharibacteria bacterium]|nr:hypothetical protein [Candidatus Saccharibacteria bacterium]